MNLLEKVVRRSRSEWNRYSEKRRLVPLYSPELSNLDSDAHLSGAIEWLKRAQDSGDDRGVAYGVKFGSDFDLSYPETTGYVCQTFVDLAARMADPDLARRAMEMGQWEAEIQLPEGAVMGGRFIAGVVVQKSLLPLDGSYLDQLVFDPLRYARIGISLVRAMGLFVENGYRNTTGLVLYGCLLTLACVGYVARLREGLTVYELFAAFNCLLLMLWPAAEADPRFLMPILPLFFLYVGEGLCRLRATSIRRVRGARRRWVSAGGPCFVCRLVHALEVGPVRDGVSTPEAVALFDWIRGQTEPEDAFVFQKPRALALYTQRRAVAPHKGADAEHLWQLLHSTGARHVVVCESSSAAAFQHNRKLVDRLIADHDTSFEKMYENPGFRVYRIRENPLASR